MARVITITGASGCGKSTAIEFFLENKNKKIGYIPKLIPKYKTRLQRKGESNDKHEDGLFIDSIPTTCDLVYEQYGARYGLRSNILYRELAKGVTPIVIVNDIRVVQDIQHMLGENVISLFLFREKPSLKAYQELTNKRKIDDKQEAITRFNKANAIYRIYIENIASFHNVILNSLGIDELEFQIKSFIVNSFGHINNNLLD